MTLYAMTTCDRRKIQTINHIECFELDFGNLTEKKKRNFLLPDVLVDTYKWSLMYTHTHQRDPMSMSKNHKSSQEKHSFWHKTLKFLSKKFFYRCTSLVFFYLSLVKDQRIVVYEYFFLYIWCFLSGMLCDVFFFSLLESKNNFWIIHILSFDYF